MHPAVKVLATPMVLLMLLLLFIALDTLSPKSAPFAVTPVRHAKGRPVASRMFEVWCITAAAAAVLLL